MPIYYFDVFDGLQHNQDLTGTELADDASARQEATRTLSDIAAQELPGDGPHRQFRIMVHDSARTVLFELQLEFNTAEADEFTDRDPG